METGERFRLPPEKPEEGTESVFDPKWSKTPGTEPRTAGFPRIRMDSTWLRGRIRGSSERLGGL